MKYERSKWLLVGLVAIFALLAVACGPAPPPTGGGGAPSGDGGGDSADGETLRIYASWPLQGSMLPIGEGMRNASNLALEHYLADHDGSGPGGYNVEIIFNDDASPVTGSWDGTVEAEIAQKCVNDPLCIAYFGTYNSGAAAVSSPITNEAGMAHITPANTSPCLTWAAPSCTGGEPDIFRPSGEQTYFRTNADDYLQGLAAASWTSCLGYEKVFLLDDRQLYGQGIATVYEQAANDIGLEVVGREGVESTDIDFRTLMGNIQNSGAELVFGGFVIDSGGVQVIQQMAAAGLFDEGVKFMGPDGLFDTALIDQVGGADVIGDGNVLLVFPGLAPDVVRDSSDQGARFYNGFVDAYGDAPDVWDSYAYQSLLIILDSIERAAASGDVTRGSVLDAMRDTNFDGVTGNIQFDENGDPLEKALGGFEVRDGTIVGVEALSTEMHESCP